MLKNEFFNYSDLYPRNLFTEPITRPTVNFMDKWFLKTVFYCEMPHPAGIYMLKVNKRNTRTSC